ncbi:MAG: hypothetical protein QM755_19105 [Luteolibacter sp.]
MFVSFLSFGAVVLLISGVGGYFLGRTRGLPWAGAVWGLAFGPVGLMLFMIRTDR